MDNKTFRSSMLLVTYFMALVALVIHWKTVWGALLAVFHVLTPLFIGMVIALILHRPVTRVQALLQKRCRRGAKALAILLVYFAVLLFLIGLFSFVIPQLGASVQMLADNWDAYKGHALGWIGQAAERLQLESIREADLSALFDKLADVVPKLFAGLVPQVYTVAAGVVRGVTNVVLGIVLSIYLLLEGPKLSRGAVRAVQAFLPERAAAKLRHIAALSFETVSQFVSGQLLEAVILGALCFVGMQLFGFEYALLISTIIGVTAVIPVLGAFIGCVPAVFVLAMISPLRALLFVVFIIVLQQIEGNLIYPKVVGSSVGLSAFWVLLAITVGGGLFGVLGMLIAVPLTAVLLQLMREETEDRLRTCTK